LEQVVLLELVVVLVVLVAILYLAHQPLLRQLAAVLVVGLTQLKLAEMAVRVVAVE
jgi:hypothetical protein